MVPQSSLLLSVCKYFTGGRARRKTRGICLPTETQEVKNVPYGSTTPSLYAFMIIRRWISWSAIISHYCAPSVSVSHPAPPVISTEPTAFTSVIPFHYWPHLTIHPRGPAVISGPFGVFIFPVLFSFVSNLFQTFYWILYYLSAPNTYYPGDDEGACTVYYLKKWCHVAYLRAAQYRSAADNWSASGLSTFSRSPL